MTEALVGLALNNLLLSAAVGLLAYGLHRKGRYPALAHLLWVLTLVAAIMPPLLTLAMPVPQVAVPEVVVAQVVDSSGVAPVVDAGAAAGSWLTANLPLLLIGVWLAGSIVMFAASTQRIVRFGRLLRSSCRPAPPGIQDMAESVAYELDMKTVPRVHVSAARLAPMTWWSGGRVRVVLPKALRSEVDDAQLRWILAHELAHIKRHDHIVRWLEWLASVTFWWNPVVWWARRNLRRDEEDACDALVLDYLQGQPRAYARTLLTVVEVMASPRGTTPALATGIDAARSLEHRFTRIISPARDHRAPRAVVAGSVGVAMLLMTVGVSAADPASPSSSPQTSVEPEVAAATVADEPTETEILSADDAPPPPPTTTPEAGSVAATPVTRFVSGRISSDGRYTGTAIADSVNGTGADETFVGLAGGDTIGGGPGSDVIYGGEGADRLRGGNGADELRGGPGRDTIGGGAGPDVIHGGAGADTIQGGAGRDTIKAGPGDDIVRTWADGTPDVVDCGSGDDRAVIGSTDTATRCESVVVRDPA